MKPLAVLALPFVLAACASPSIARTETRLTPKQIADMGLVCREIRPPDSNIPRMVCASPEAWAAEDRREADVTENIERELDTGSGVNGFRR